MPKAEPQRKDKAPQPEHKVEAKEHGDAEDADVDEMPCVEEELLALDS